MAKAGTDIFTHPFPEGEILESVSTSQPPLLWGGALSSLTHSVPLERGPGLHSELTVMSGAHPTWPANGQICSGPTGDAYLAAF